MKALIEALERGAYLREALEYVGVKRADLQQWLDRAELGYAPYVWFPSAFERGKESAREARGADRPGEVSIRVSLETGEVLRPRTPVGWVYFIQAGAQGPVKIGFAEKSVARRLGELQVAHFEKLRLLGAVRADQGAEQEIHALFEDARVQGEWFALSEGLQRVLTELPRLSKFECTPVQIVAEIGRVATSVSG